jgi:hypothetical protein
MNAYAAPLMKLTEQLIEPAQLAAEGGTEMTEYADTINERLMLDRIAELDRQIAEARKAATWVRVEDGLPEKAYGDNWLVWVKCGNKEGGYVTLAAYGDYVYEDEFADHNDPNYMKDNDPRCDEGNMCGSGWYREEVNHGGLYDSIMVDLNGDVTHYMPKPKRPTGA